MNFQNIPARGDIVTVRCMCKASVNYNEFNSDNNTFMIPIEEEVEMNDGSYKWSSELLPGDIVEGNREVVNVEVNGRIIIITLK